MQRQWRGALNPAGLVSIALIAASCQIPEAIGVLDELAQRSKQQEFSGADLNQVRRHLTYRIADRTREADLYERLEDGLHTHAAIVLVPGLTPTGKDDPRLVALALALSKGRFAVLVPDMPNLRAARVGVEDVEAIGDAVRHLGSMGYRRVGVHAISYAVGPALVAATQPDLREHIGFLLAIGGYYDSEAVIRHFTTGHHRSAPGEAWVVGQPHPAAKWLFAKSNVAYIADSSDRTLLTAIADAKHADPTRDMGALTRRLKAEGRAVLALVENTDPERVSELIGRLPPRIRAALRALNPAERNLRDELRAHLILVHGKDDKIVPAAESLRLAQAVGPGRADLYIVDRLFHADLGSPSWHDRIVLLNATIQLLRKRGHNANAWRKSERRPATCAFALSAAHRPTVLRGNAGCADAR